MDNNTRKRHLLAPANGKRVPLAETSANIPLPVLKKAKLVKTGVPSALSVSITKENHEQENPQEAQEARKKTETHKAARLVGEELKSWQASWRKIMRESVVYFDTQGCDSNNQTQHQEQKRAQRALKAVGCEIVPFYDRDVSIIVSRRAFSNAKSYPSNDIFNDAVNLKIKVWDFDKVFRFLKNLGVSETANLERSGNLSNLLKEEKIFGSTDRDPNARRDDLHYLEKKFIYVYDLSQAVRPIAVREWSNDSYPSLYLTMDGKCPFIPDTSENLEKKKARRLQKFEATKSYRELLKKISYDIISFAKDGFSMSNSVFSGTSTSTDYSQGNSDEQTLESGSTVKDEATEEKSPTSDSNEHISNTTLANYNFKVPASLMRLSSVVQPSANHSTSKFYDVAASGFNGASNAMQFSMDSTLNSVAQQANQGNGLGPAVSQVPSKNINNLKRRIFMKRQIQKAEGRERERELKPGYCENCRVKYDNFEDHINSNRHRNFACNDENFKDIDELIATLNESKSMGYVTSNGDYSFAS